MSTFSLALAALSLGSIVQAQQAGVLTAEKHPPLSVSTCTSSGCTSKTQSVVLDGNWRWLHSTSGSTNCYTGNTWDKTLCPDGVTCAKNCALDGADYPGTYGIKASGSSLSLQFKTGSNVGSRVYLMNEADTAYQTFNLKNKEFTFDVDVSQLVCKYARPNPKKIEKPPELEKKTFLSPVSISVSTYTFRTDTIRAAADSHYQVV
jgi:cellulose 1,4-beta-cellobiosidase